MISINRLSEIIIGTIFKAFKKTIADYVEHFIFS